MKHNGHLGTAEAGRLLGVHPITISVHIGRGHIRARRRGTGRTSHGWIIAWADLVEYWRTYRRGACARCGIMGEASEDLGFMCGPCAYEVETGRIWWPSVSRRTAYRLPEGRLPLALELKFGQDWRDPHVCRLR